MGYSLGLGRIGYALGVLICVSSASPFPNNFKFVCGAFAVAGSVPMTANENFLSKPPEEWTEAEARQVLNNSPWARVVTTTVQNTQCDYEHPAFEGLFPAEMARSMDSMSPEHPAETVKPDGAEYVVRLISVKPMQAAVERLISLDEKWAPYRHGYGLDPEGKPTNLAEDRYDFCHTTSHVLEGKIAKTFSFRARMLQHHRDRKFVRRVIQGPPSNRNLHVIPSYCRWETPDNTS